MARGRAHRQQNTARGGNRCTSRSGFPAVDVIDVLAVLDDPMRSKTRERIVPEPRRCHLGGDGSVPVPSEKHPRIWLRHRRHCSAGRTLVFGRIDAVTEDAVAEYGIEIPGIEERVERPDISDHVSLSTPPLPHPRHDVHRPASGAVLFDDSRIVLRVAPAAYPEYSSARPELGRAQECRKDLSCQNGAIGRSPDQQTVVDFSDPSAQLEGQHPPEASNDGVAHGSHARISREAVGGAGGARPVGLPTRRVTSQYADRETLVHSPL